MKNICRDCQYWNHGDGELEDEGICYVHNEEGERLKGARKSCRDFVKRKKPFEEVRKANETY